MNYCSECGSLVELLVPEGDDRPRHICAACGCIHYQNPKIVVGSIPRWDETILLCRRAIEPRYGRWTLPAGFMENGETSQQGAAREALEEANARVAVGRLYSLFNLPHVDQVYLIFRSRLLNLDIAPGDESLEVGLFAESEVPWAQIAFPVVEETLRLYFRDRHDAERVRMGDVQCLDGDMRRYRIQMHDPGKGS